MTPWQYLRTIDNNLDLHTGTRSAITGMRAATGGRQPAAAKPSLYFYVVFAQLLFWACPYRTQSATKRSGCRIRR